MMAITADHLPARSAPQQRVRRTDQCASQGNDVGVFGSMLGRDSGAARFIISGRGVALPVTLKDPPGRMLADNWVGSGASNVGCGRADLTDQRNTF